MSRTNVIVADMKGRNKCYADPVYQYDVGMTLQILNFDLPETFEAHFSNDPRGKSKSQIGSNGEVHVPAEYFEPGKYIYVWIYVHPTPESSVTDAEIIIPVAERAAKTNVEPDPDEQSVIEQAIAALNDGVETVQEIAAAIPDTIDAALQEAKDSGEFDGFSPTATVTKEGKTATISITDVNGTTTADVTDGEDGEDGYSPTANVVKEGRTATITITDQNGTTTAQVTDGTDGQNGRGVPAGGNPGQILTKASNTDYDLGWSNAPNMDGYVRNTDYATNSKGGVAKISNDLGIEMFTTGPRIGFASTYPAQDLNIKRANDGYAADTYRPITPANQHKSAFYGLAKAAGDNTQANSDNPVGTYTANAKDAIQHMLDVPSNADLQNAIAHIETMDIHICAQGEYDPATGIPTIQNPDEDTIYLVPGGTSPDLFAEWIYVNNAWEKFGVATMDLTSYVQFADIAGTSKTGVVKIDGSKGIVADQNGVLQIANAQPGTISAGTDAYKPITPGVQHQSVFYGLAKAAGDDTQSASDNPVGEYTADAKSAIQEMLEIPVERGSGVGSVQTKAYVSGNTTYTQVASGIGAFAEGLNTTSSGQGSHSEGGGTKAIGHYAHSEGRGTFAKSNNSHSEGQYTVALGTAAHSEGYGISGAVKLTSTSNPLVYAYENSNSQHLNASCALQYGDLVTSISSVDTNAHTITVGSTIGNDLNKTSVALYTSVAIGVYSHIEGLSSISTTGQQHVQGKYNALGSYADIVGNGTSDTDRSNAFALTWTGDGRYAGDIYVGCNPDSTGGTKLEPLPPVATEEETRAIISDYEEDEDMVFETEFVYDHYVTVDDAQDIFDAYSAGKHVVIHFPAQLSYLCYETFISMTEYEPEITDPNDPRSAVMWFGYREDSGATIGGYIQPNNNDIVDGKITFGVYID